MLYGYVLAGLLDELFDVGYVVGLCVVEVAAVVGCVPVFESFGVFVPFGEEHRELVVGFA